MNKDNNITLKLTIVLFCAMVVTLFMYTYFSVYNVEIFHNVTKNKRMEIQQTFCEIESVSLREELGIHSGNMLPLSLVHSYSDISKDGYTLLNCSTIYQNPTLPNGCEITSATMVLQYLGYNVSKEVMSDKYLDKQEPYYDVNPNIAYMVIRVRVPKGGIASQL